MNTEFNNYPASKADQVYIFITSSASWPIPNAPLLYNNRPMLCYVHSRCAIYNTASN